MKPLLLHLVLVLLCVVAVPARAVNPGETPPAFALLDGRGNLVALDRLQGRVVYVDFWASWCGPCRQSFPWMNSLQQRYPDRLVIVAVNVDRRRSDADRFLQEHPAQFTIVFDAAGATPSAWNVAGMPSSYLVDPTGKVVAVETGFDETRAKAMEERVRALVSK